MGVLKVSSVKQANRPDISSQDWYTYFESLQTNASHEDGSQGEDVENNALLNDPIADNEIRQSIKRLKSGKASGLDGIGAEFYKKKTCENIVYWPVPRLVV